MMDVGDEERLAMMVAALDRLVAAELAALRRELTAATLASDKAIELAAGESKERLAAHNGLIEQMRQQAAHFATREIVEANRETYVRRFDTIDRWQARLTGALVLVAIAMPLITGILVHWFTQ